MDFREGGKILFVAVRRISHVLDCNIWHSTSVKPRTLVGAAFLEFLSENEAAFDLLYCITFKLLDHLWLAMRASYMDFNVDNNENHSPSAGKRAHNGKCDAS